MAASVALAGGDQLTTVVGSADGEDFDLFADDDAHPAPGEHPERYAPITQAQREAEPALGQE